jgi:hypothetical protein
MLIIRLQGGLGNQLFQWATGHALAQLRQDSLRFDVSHYLIKGKRSLDLGRLGLPVPVLSTSSRWLRRCFPDTTWGNRLHNWQKLRLPVNLHPYRNDKLWPSLETAVQDRRSVVYLDGYWQHHEWFADRADLLRNQLRLGLARIRLPDEVYAAIRRCDVVLHVRRGDYLNASVQNGGLGPLSDDYYRRGIQQLRDQGHRIDRIGVISDDPLGASVLDLGSDSKNCLVITGQGDHMTDFATLVQARALIIANSSFSWWAAWIACGIPVIIPADWSGMGLADSGPGMLPGWTAA